MTYRKPEISILGDAARVIQILGKPLGNDLEVADGQYLFDPAYDLDE